MKQYNITSTLINSHNPYFNGILSAIAFEGFDESPWHLSQSLFYWNPFCNHEFYGIPITDKPVTILILLESFLQ